VGGELWLDNNALLTDITPLSNLSTIGQSLNILNNSMLNCLTGLENLSPGTIQNLSIYNNPLLSECDVMSICDYLANPGGICTIVNNAVGCNSPEEVEVHCLTAIDEQRIEKGLTIIPNPSNNKITISSNAITGNTLLSIFNVSGEKVIERQLFNNETQIDISALPRGVYFVRVQDEKGVQVAKFVKE
jgi:hypothetical protein